MRAARQADRTEAPAHAPALRTGTAALVGTRAVVLERVDADGGQVKSAGRVIYSQVTDPKAATYEIADYIGAIEQLTVTTLRT